MWIPRRTASVALLAIGLVAACGRETEVKLSGPAGRLQVDDGGAGGVPIVFVHSFGGSSAQWKQQLEHLRPTRRAVAVDLRGHGESDAPPDADYSIAAFAGDIAAAVDRLKIDRFVLVGHSLGGVAALEYARRNPDRVSGLVLVATPGKSPPEVRSKILAAMEADYEQVSAEYWNKLLGDARPPVEQRIRKDMKRLRRESALAMMRAVFAYDPTEALRTYRGPTLLVDLPATEGPGSLHQLAPGLPRTVITGTSHWPQLDKPRDFNGVLDELLERIRDSELRSAM